MKFAFDMHNDVFLVDVFWGASSKYDVSHMKGGIVWRTLNVRSYLMDESVIHTYNYPVF